MSKIKSRALKPGWKRAADGGSLLDLLVQRVALEEGIVLLLLDAFRDGLLIARGEVAGNGFPLLLGFGAFQGDDFLHSIEKVEGSGGKARPG